MLIAAMLGLALAPPVVTVAPAVCAEAEITEFGLACDAEEPCAVYLELTSLAAAGDRIAAAGNLHTDTLTLWSILLMSSDAGATWSEPFPRRRGAALDLVEFIDVDTGWAAGHISGALARDPFVVRTTDGGATWLAATLGGDESIVGAIEQLYFDSKSVGAAVVHRSAGHYQRWLSSDGGATWTLGEQMPAAPTQRARTALLRVRADARSATQTLERRQGQVWTPVAVFPIRAGECRPKPPQPTP